MKRRALIAALAVALAAAMPAWAQSDADAYPADIDCNDPYYASYCLAYANWLAQYYPAYGYGWYYGPVDVAFGFGFFAGHRFRNFHRFAFAHGIGFRGGFHGSGFHGGGFHGGGGHR